MKKLIVPLLLLSVLFLAGCWVKKWDIVTCVTGVSEQKWEVMYRKWNYIVVSWVMTYYEYWTDIYCPVELDKYWNCTRETSRIWQRTLNINSDYCTRENNYEDMIRIRKKEDKNNN